jgi:hypothetical protein
MAQEFLSVQGLKISQSLIFITLSGPVKYLVGFAMVKGE